MSGLLLHLAHQNVAVTRDTQVCQLHSVRYTEIMNYGCVEQAIVSIRKNHLCFFVLTVAPAMNLKVRGVTDRTIDLEWEGSVVLTDFLVTYTPSSAGGKYRAVLAFPIKKENKFQLIQNVLKAHTASF